MRWRRTRGPAASSFAGAFPTTNCSGLLARCRALVVPGEEDFGMTPVEALASGKPVIALGRGGSLESVPTADPLGGVFYDEPDEAHLAEAIARFESMEAQVRPRELQAWAEQFSERHFLAHMRDVLASESGRHYFNVPFSLATPRSVG